MRLRGKHWRTAKPIDLVISGDRIQSLGPADRNLPADLAADWLAPAFFDLQINGGMGTGFTSPRLTEEAIRGVVELCRTHGIAAFCPTVVTSASATLQSAFQSLRQACERDHRVSQALPRFHLEGPYISPEDGPRGAHPREHVRPPDEDEFQRLQEAAGGRIGLVTLAPEIPGALPFIERRAPEGVVVSIGHSRAEPAAIRAAIAAGAKLSTHLGNACARLLPRHENLLWEQLAADELMASLIPDGFHLPWSLVRCFLRMKEPARIILTCDSSEHAGLPPGQYGQWNQRVEVHAEGKIVLAGQGILAGSWAFTDLCVERLSRQGFCSLVEVLDMVHRNPRQLLGLPVPTLAAGEQADVVLLRQDPQGGVRLVASVIGGQARPGPGGVEAG